MRRLPGWMVRRASPSQRQRVPSTSIQRGAISIDGRAEQRYQYDVETGNEGGFRRRGKAQAGGLQIVAEEQHATRPGLPPEAPCGSAPRSVIRPRKNSASMTVARLNRSARNSRVETSARASLTSTKVVPQTIARNTMAESARLLGEASGGFIARFDFSRRIRR